MERWSWRGVGRGGRGSGRMKQAATAGTGMPASTHERVWAPLLLSVLAQRQASLAASPPILLFPAPPARDSRPPICVSAAAGARDDSPTQTLSASASTQPSQPASTKTHTIARPSLCPTPATRPVLPRVCGYPVVVVVSTARTLTTRPPCTREDDMPHPAGRGGRPVMMRRDRRQVKRRRCAPLIGISRRPQAILEASAATSKCTICARLLLRTSAPPPGLPRLPRLALSRHPPMPPSPPPPISGPHGAINLQPLQLTIPTPRRV